MVDGSGDLILFSGSGYGESGFFPSSLNDLWLYDISANEWTWLEGSKSIGQSGIFGTQGTGSPGTRPGSRVHAVSWSDHQDNFWVFSGYGKASLSGNGYLNDMWKYDFSAGNWIWMSGDTIVNQTGVYSDSCAATANNKPGGRQAAVSWLDDVAGIYYVYGGQGYNAGSTVGQLNDLWAYDRFTSQWSWIRGTAINENGAYGSPDVGDPANIPGGRNHPAGWRFNSTLWLFGGAGYPASGGAGILNDLWVLPFYSVCGNAPLPVSLLEFTAEKGENRQVRLQWTTASESNTSSFTVERSVNGFRFEKLATVPAAGNSTHTNTYEVLDRDPLQGISYYRLASTSFDGRYTIESIVVSVNFGVFENGGRMQVIPNPVSKDVGEVYFTLPGAVTGPAEVMLVNMNGRKITSMGFSESAATRSAGMLPVPAGLTPGIYTLICVTGDETFSTRFIIR